MNIFTLFGDLQLKSQSFESSLKRSQAEMMAAEKRLDHLENKARRFGNTSAVTARQHQKFNEQIGMARTRLTNFAQAYDKGHISGAKFSQVIASTENKMAALNGRLKDSSARLDDWRTKSLNAGGSMSQLGMYVGAATLAIGAFSTKASMDLENTRNKFTALEGSVEKANIRIQKLLDLSRKSAGVSFEDAAQGFAFLQTIGTVSESNIEKMIQALGRMQMAFKNTMGTSQEFLLNLQQLFDQGFEAQDWKQAIGRVAIWEQLVEKAFGTKDPERLRELKASGKLTMDTWIASIADAANQDSRLAALKETFSIKLSKALSELNLQIAPLGDKIIEAMRPVLDVAMAEFAKPDPKYFNIADEFGKQIGKKIAAGIIEGWKTEKPPEGFITDWFTNMGLTGPITKGLLEGFGYTPDFSGFFNAIKDANLKIVGLFDKIGADIAAWFVGLGGTIGHFANSLGATAFSVGKAIGQGLVNGIRSMFDSVGGAAREIGTIAEAAARARLDTRSPSKVFFKIGKDVAQGFIDGIAAMRASVSASMASLFDVTGIKGLGKKDAPGVELLTGFVNEIARFNVEGKKANAILDLTAGKYGKLNAAVRERILQAATEIDRLNDLKEGQEKFNDIFEDYITKFLPEKTAIEELNEALAGPKVQAWLATMNERVRNLVLSVMQWNAAQKDLAQTMQDINAAQGSGRGGEPGTGGLVFTPPPGFKLGPDGELLDADKSLAPPILSWNRFWDMMRARLAEFKNSLPSFKQALGENLVASIERLGDVFGNAVAQWDGTLKGFWQSLVQGFRQMVSAIVAELVRLMVIKAVLSLIGSVAGGAAGSVGGGASGGGGAGGGFGGSGWGWGGGHRASGMMPALPGGGMTDSRVFSPTFNMNFSAGTSQQTAIAASQAVREAWKVLQREQMRNK